MWFLSPGWTQTATRHGVEEIEKLKTALPDPVSKWTKQGDGKGSKEGGIWERRECR